MCLNNKNVTCKTKILQLSKDVVAWSQHQGQTRIHNQGGGRKRGILMLSSVKKRLDNKNTEESLIKVNLYNNTKMGDRHIRTAWVRCKRSLVCAHTPTCCCPRCPRPWCPWFRWSWRPGWPGGCHSSGWTSGQSSPGPGPCCPGSWYDACLCYLKHYVMLRGCVVTAWRLVPDARPGSRGGRGRDQDGRGTRGNYRSV